jgi:hypothetical protein
MARCREKAANRSNIPCKFNGCLGVADVKEYQEVMYLDPVKEGKSWREKNKQLHASFQNESLQSLHFYKSLLRKE